MFTFLPYNHKKMAVYGDKNLKKVKKYKNMAQKRVFISIG